MMPEPGCKWTFVPALIVSVQAESTWRSQMTCGLSLFRYRYNPERRAGRAGGGLWK